MARKPVLSMALIVLVVLFLFTTRKYTQHSDALSRYTNANSAEDVTTTDPNSSGSKAQDSENMHENRHNAHMHDSMDESMEQMHEKMGESMDDSMEHMHEEMSESKDSKMESEMQHMNEEMESTDTERMKEQMDHENHENHDDMEKAHMKDSNDDKTVNNSQKVSDNIPDMEELAKGKPIMAKMPNQTIRAQVGNAGWKLLHTILAQYPEEPTEEDQQTLGTFLKFFSRVYPCRECAEHFQDLLASYPPQLSSRKAAAMWGCDAHNKVNKRLGKPIFDCAYIFDKYDCGCGEEAEGDEGTGSKSDKKTTTNSESTKPNAEKPTKQESTEEMMSTDK